MVQNNWLNIGIVCSLIITFRMNLLCCYWILVAGGSCETSNTPPTLLTLTTSTVLTISVSWYWGSVSGSRSFMWCVGVDGKASIVKNGLKQAKIKHLKCPMKKFMNYRKSELFYKTPCMNKQDKVMSCNNRFLFKWCKNQRINWFYLIANKVTNIPCSECCFMNLREKWNWHNF